MRAGFPARALVGRYQAAAENLPVQPDRPNPEAHRQPFRKSAAGQKRTHKSTASFNPPTSKGGTFRNGRPSSWLIVSAVQGAATRTSKVDCTACGRPPAAAGAPNLAAIM